MKYIYKFLYSIILLSVFVGLSAQDLIHLQDFENGAGDWTLEGAWQIGNVDQNSSDDWMYPDSQEGIFASYNDATLGEGSEMGAVMISPILDFSSFSNIILTYEGYYSHGNFQNAGQEQFGVRISIDGGETWVPIYNHDRALDKFNRNAIVLNNYAGLPSVRLAFEYQDGGNWNYGVGIDNIMVFEPLPRSTLITMNDEVHKLISAKGDSAAYAFQLTNLGTVEIIEAQVQISSEGQLLEQIIETNLSFGQRLNFTMDLPEGWYESASIRVSNINGLSIIEDPTIVDFAVTAPVPNFTQLDVNGQEVELHNLLARNHIVTLMFYASWCGPCQQMMPEVNALWTDLGQGENGFDVLGLTTHQLDSNEAILGLNWGANFNSFGYSFQSSIINELFSNQFASNGIPFFVQICPNSDNPGFGSSISYQSTGWPGASPFVSAAQECNSLVGTNNFVDAEIVSGIENRSNLFGLTVYPNPIDATSNIYFSLDQEEQVFVSIVDVLGKNVFSRNLGARFGNVKINLSELDLVKGIYTVNLQIGSDNIAKKVLVLN